MRKAAKLPLLVLLTTFLFNVMAVGSTIVLHEVGHYMTAEQAGCKNIKLVLIDSEYGTYTEMACPESQPVYFAVFGAMLLTTPFALMFFLLKSLPERNLLWIMLGFNLTIMMADMPFLRSVRMSVFAVGILLFIIGQIRLIDDLFVYLEGPLGMVGLKLAKTQSINDKSFGVD